MPTPLARTGVHCARHRGPPMRITLVLVLAALVCSCSSSGGPELWGSASDGAAHIDKSRPRGDLRVEIHRPTSNLRLSNWETSIEIEGRASVFGGVKQIDLMLVLDTSQSLSRTAGHQYQLLGHTIGKAYTIEPYLITISDESEVYPEFQHAGTEFIYMLEGRVTYRHANKTYLLEPGDSLFFDAEALHGPDEILELPCRFLSIIVSQSSES